MRPHPRHRTPDYIFRTRRSGGGGDKNHGGFGSMKVLECAGDLQLIFDDGHCEIGRDAETFQTLPHDIFKELTGAIATHRVSI